MFKNVANKKIMDQIHSLDSITRAIVFSSYNNYNHYSNRQNGNNGPKLLIPLLILLCIYRK